MTKKRILILEDEAIIGMHLKTALVNLGYEVAGVVHTAQDAIDRCRKSRPDLILMDIVIPGELDGIDAAKAIMNTHDIPVVYLTGNADIATVSRARETNPYGYVIKPINAQHLFSTIDTALHRHGLEMKLRESEEKYRRIAENMVDLISWVDRGGRFTYLSPSHRKILGYDLDELYRMDFVDVVHPDDRKFVIDAYKNFIGKQPFIRGEFRCHHADGHYIWMDSTTTYLFTHDGSFDGAVFSSRDITERKIAEAKIRESEERYLSLFNRSLDCIYLHDFSGNFIDANDAALNLLGYTRDEIKKVNFQSMLSEDQLPVAIAMIGEILNTGLQKEKKELKLKTKSGGLLFVEALGSIIYREGEPYAVQGVARNITDRKMAEEALRESEAKHRLITDMMSDVVWTTDANLKITYMSPSVEKVMGFTVEERMSQQIGDITTPESLAKVMEKFADEMRKEATAGADPDRIVTFDFEHNRKDGSTVMMENVVKAIRDSDGRILGLHGVSHDITDRKSAVEALKQSEEKFRALFDQSSAGVFMYDRDLVVLDCNNQFADIIKAPRERIIGLNLNLLKEKGIIQGIRDVLEGKTTFYEGPYLSTLTGSTPWISSTVSPLRGAGRDIIGGIGVVIDITNLKRTEEALLERDESFQAVFAQSPVGIILYSNEFKVTNCNKRFADMLQSTQEKIIGLDLSRLREKAVIPILKEALDGTISYYDGPYHATTSDAVRWVSFSASPLRGIDGEVKGGLLVIVDLTESHEAEVTLRERDEIFRAVFDQSPAGIVLFSRDLMVANCNKRYAEIMHSTREKIIGFDMKNLRDKTVTPTIMEALDGKMSIYEGPYMASTSDAKLWVSFSASPIRDINDEVVGAMIVVVDITERWKAEEALRESEERYRYLFDNANDFVFIVNLDQKFTSLNKLTLDATGYSREEALNLRISDVLAPEYIEIAQGMILKKMENGEPTTYEVEIITKNGRRIPLELNTQLIMKEGKPVGIQGIGRDISERRHMEEQIRRSLREKETLLKEVHHRVKNNFQVIMSLINLQSASIENRDLQKYFADAQNRIRSMALVHEKLYQSDDISRLDISSYVSTIVSELYSSYPGMVSGCEPRIEAGRIDLDIDQAIPCGLIINELVTNAFKYAFPPGWKGKPDIAVFVSEQAGMIELVVSDNGVGMPESVDLGKTRTLGLTLVPMLAKQLRGTLEVDRSGGTRFVVRFPKK